MIYHAAATGEIPNVDLLTLLFGMMDLDMSLCSHSHTDALQNRKNLAHRMTLSYTAKLAIRPCPTQNPKRAQ
jgi:hypothetical protein